MTYLNAPVASDIKDGVRWGVGAEQETILAGIRGPCRLE